jgi:hypothetical protein
MSSQSQKKFNNERLIPSSILEEEHNSENEIDFNEKLFLFNDNQKSNFIDSVNHLDIIKLLFYL